MYKKKRGNYPLFRNRNYLTKLETKTNTKYTTTAIFVRNSSLPSIEFFLF